jgi:hypothetical protein
MRPRALLGVAAVLALGASTVEARRGVELLTFSVRDERAPAGSMVQMKVKETEPTPISGGRPRMRFSADVFDGVRGIGLFAPTGEAAGAAILDGNFVTITYVTTTPLTGGEYPVLTVTLALRPDAAPGTRTVFTLEPASIWTIGGRTMASKASSGTVTVGGTLAITDVTPAGGLFPAGTVISVRGVGFNARTRIRLNGTRLGPARVVSPTEIQLTLPRATDMSGAELRADDSGQESTTYYAYLRGIPAATSQRPLLATSLPVFSGVARTLATLGSLPAMTPPYQYAAVAVQNPSLQPASMTLVLYAANGGVLGVTTRSLASGHRMMLELTELFGGARTLPGSSVRVLSSVPVQTFGLVVDERIQTVTPRLPVEATP